MTTEVARTAADVFDRLVGEVATHRDLRVLSKLDFDVEQPVGAGA